MISLYSAQRNWASSRLEGRTSWIFSSCGRCSRLTKGTSGTRSCGLRKGQSPSELLGGLSGFLSPRCRAFHALASAGLHCDSRQNTLRNVFPLQAGPSIKSQQQHVTFTGDMGSGGRVPQLQCQGRQPRHSYGGTRPQTQAWGPLPGAQLGQPAPGQPAPGQRRPVTRGGSCSPQPTQHTACF